MNKIFTVSALVLGLGAAANAFAAGPANPRGGFTGPSLNPTTVAEVLKMGDDKPVVLVGKIEKSLGDEKYLFRDASGTIVVEIDNEDWNGVNVTPNDTVELRGETDKDYFKNPKVDVDAVIKQ